jgi:hypothetical protein
LRPEERRALFRPDDLPFELFRALFRADPRLPFLADFLADLRLLRLLDFLADFLAPFREEDFLAELRLDLRDDFLADFRLGADLLRDREVESSMSSYDAGVEAGVGAGVLSIGSGSIQPEPDQPISM